MKIAAAICVHDDHWFLSHAIRAFKGHAPVYCFVSTHAWDGTPGNYEKVVEIAKAEGAKVVVGHWPSEAEHRTFALAQMKEQGFDYIFIPDSDEVPEPQLIEALKKIAESKLADIVRVHMETYWKDACHVVRPPEQLAPILLVNCQAATHTGIREYQGERSLVLGPEFGLLHHLSYAGPDERIQRKLSTWGHRDEVVLGWYERIWLGWEDNPLLRDLHPTHPQCYREIERVPPISMLAGLPLWRPDLELEPPPDWAKISIVIPVYGAAEELRLCLNSLEICRDLLYEVIVSDDFSPDDSVQVAKKFEWMTVIESQANTGFAGATNRGLAQASGDVVIFLNSDMIVTRAGLIRLVETLMSHPTIGAAGPVSNNVGYYQRIVPTYSKIENLAAFATDLAQSSTEDVDVDMLVGFALAIKKTVLDQVGDFDERFGPGLFEDTDLCYRIQRAGYKLKVAARAYMHHWGSRTLSRILPDPTVLMNLNGRIYKEKWKDDVDGGYASHLPGFSIDKGPVKFDERKNPAKLEKRIARLKDAADITLCMIVRNEERVLADCLRSALPFFKQIVVVDTGSTDRTVEIAKSFGVEVYETEWQMSFSEARNESLKYAKGRWVFWMDADDTLRWWAGEALLESAINAPREVAGFYVPVQFVDQGPAGGTRVDHVKLFRNFPDVRFWGRIHEQIIDPIRVHGDIRRSGALVHHSGYDNSEEGQRRKRERDEPLLWLDYQDRPDHPFPRWNLGMTFHFTARHEEAVEWLGKCLEVSHPGESLVRKAYALLGESLWILGRPAEAMAVYEEARKVVGNDAEVYFNQARLYSAQGAHEMARDCYLAMDTNIDDHISSIDISILGFKRSHNLGTCYAACGDYLNARAWLTTSIQENPQFVESSLQLFELALANADFLTAGAALAAIESALGRNEEWADRRGRLAEESEGAGAGLRVIAAEVDARPAQVGARLTLVRWLMAREMVVSAMPHLRLLADQGNAECTFLLGVVAQKRGRLEEATLHTERAVHLNPYHERSRAELDRLISLHGDLPNPRKRRAELLEVIAGPHRGTLGQAKKPISVVVVAYNSEKYICDCLARVSGAAPKGTEIIVVDNASEDGTVALVKKTFGSRVKVIANKRNLGYSAAANLGILASKGELIVLLNPDTEPTGEWLEKLDARVEAGVAAVGPMSDNVAGDQFVGFTFPQGFRPKKEEIPEFLPANFGGESTKTKFIAGFCMAVPRKVFNEIGLLDDGLFLGADDLEFCWRARALGLSLVIAKDAFVGHIGGASFATRSPSEAREDIKLSDDALIAKLKKVYGSALPTSHCVWGNGIFAEALSRR